MLVGRARAGLRPGDIVQLDGRPTRSQAAFGGALARHGGERTITVTLGELPLR